MKQLATCRIQTHVSSEVAKRPYKLCWGCCLSSFSILRDIHSVGSAAHGGSLMHHQHQHYVEFNEIKHWSLFILLLIIVCMYLVLLFCLPRNPDSFNACVMISSYCNFMMKMISKGSLQKRIVQVRKNAKPME